MIATVNLATQAELRELMGHDALHELLQEAAHQFAGYATDLKDALDRGAGEAARVLAHRLKGSMGSLGYDALFHCLNALEKRLASDPRDLPGPVELEAIHSTLEQVSDALQPYRTTVTRDQPGR